MDVTLRKRAQVVA